MEPILTIPDFPLDGSVKTLGWQAAEWGESYLLQPDGDLAGEPFRYTREQLNVILWFYAVDAHGEFIYRRAVLRRAKGWGKSPLMAAIALTELCGPVRFGGWDANGEPVAIRQPVPWIVIAGVSQTQAENTMLSIRGMAEDSALVDDYDVEPGMTRILIPSGGKIVPLTASSAAQEGARPTFGILDETHHWTQGNGGHKLARVIRRNLAKVRGRSFETTNAHAPGEDSVAEHSYLAWRAMEEGRTRVQGLLYDSREAPADVDLANNEQLMDGLRVTYGDATWVDLSRIRDEVYDPGTPPEESRRFYLNQITAAADSWLAPAEWQANYRPELRPLKLADPGDWKRGDTVTLGFDGSLTDDSTALVACRVEDGALFLLAIWEHPEGAAGKGWTVPKAEVRDAVDAAFSRLDVVAMFSDVAYWETDIDAWRDQYGERLRLKATTRHAVGYDMRSHQMDTTRAVEALHRAILDGECPWGDHRTIAGKPLNGHEVMTRHFLNARRRVNRWGVYFGKETRESQRKVDVVASSVLARYARTRYLSEVGSKRRGPGRLYGF